MCLGYKATRQEALQFQVGYRNPIESIAHAFVALNPKALKVINQHIKECPIKATHPTRRFVQFVKGVPKGAKGMFRTFFTFQQIFCIKTGKNH